MRSGRSRMREGGEPKERIREMRGGAKKKKKKKEKP